MLTSAEIFNNHKIIPVITINNIVNAIPLAKSLLDGGINIMEITMRTLHALEIVELIRQKVPQMLVGVGTVININSYQAAINHGAQFIVSPGLTTELVNVSQKYSTPFIPGAITPSEVMHANNNEIKYLKFFPAESYNGLNTLKAFAAVFPGIKFCPTGGITMDNIDKYLQLGNVTTVGASFIFNEQNNDFNKVTEISQILTRKYYAKQ